MTLQIAILSALVLALGAGLGSGEPRKFLRSMLGVPPHEPRDVVVTYSVRFAN